MKSIVLILLVGQCLAASKYSWLKWWKVEEREKPEFCGSYECPDFTVIQKFKGYELRRYNASVWVSVDNPGMQEDYWEDRSYEKETFMKLFRYIQGDNSLNMTIDMTVPVLNTHSKDSVSMSFMLPAEHAHNPPTPNDPNITIYRSSGGDIFVRSFSGFAYGLFGYTNRYKTNLAALEWHLKRDGQKYDNHTGFYTAGYNGPWELFNRHNEVWMRT